MRISYNQQPNFSLKLCERQESYVRLTLYAKTRSVLVEKTYLVFCAVVPVVLWPCCKVIKNRIFRRSKWFMGKRTKETNMYIREYWMIYRWPGFLAVIRFGSVHNTSPTLPSVICLSFSVFLCVAGPAYCREGGRGAGTRRQIIRPRKAWPSISHSLLPDVHCRTASSFVILMQWFPCFSSGKEKVIVGVYYRQKLERNRKVDKNEENVCRER